MGTQDTDEDGVNAGGGRVVDDVRLDELGKRLADLGAQLQTTGGHTTSWKIDKSLDRALQLDVGEVWAEHSELTHDAVRRTLAGMGSFRKDYANWERIVVEYALSKEGFTQREVARLLGVGLSTVNRWAQHPLTYED